MDDNGVRAMTGFFSGWSLLAQKKRIKSSVRHVREDSKIKGCNYRKCEL